MALPEGFEVAGVVTLINRVPFGPDGFRADPIGSQDASQIDGRHGIPVVPGTPRTAAEAIEEQQEIAGGNFRVSNHVEGEVDIGQQKAEMTLS
ncbi:MAG TPA: hypothetical protein VHA33_20935 [Candidatus Angelobacter sp.]|nr:hypothetical protein [Candidatus Angelobacter sp.]